MVSSMLYRLGEHPVIPPFPVCGSLEAAMKVYSLFDRKVKEYGQLVLAKNDEVVRRMALDAVKGSGGPIEQHPEDFDLYHVGEFDNEKGCLEVVVPTLVVCMADLLEVTDEKR